MDESSLRELVRRALDEDAAGDDITTLATVPEHLRGRARLLANQDAVIAGLDAFVACFRALDPGVEIKERRADGERVRAGDEVAVLEGPLRPILTAERTALNLVQRLSGVATLARAFVEAAPGVQIRDTRKTTPGLRTLEKEAVVAGGATNHRRDLAAAVLIKDNHIVAAGGITTAVARARAAQPDRWVEVECETIEGVREALDAGADEILLDNMDPPALADAVKVIAGRARTEASGGVTLDTVAAIAATGVDVISVGALTHSAPAVDVSLTVEVL